MFLPQRKVKVAKANRNSNSSSSSSSVEEVEEEIAVVDEAIAPEVGDQVRPGHEEHLVRQRHLKSAQGEGSQANQAAARTQFHDALVLPVVGGTGAEQAG